MESPSNCRFPDQRTLPRVVARCYDRNVTDTPNNPPEPTGPREPQLPPREPPNLPRPGLGVGTIYRSAAALPRAEWISLGHRVATRARLLYGRWERVERRLVRQGATGRLALETVYLGLAFLTGGFTLYLRVQLACRDLGTAL